MGKSKDPRKFSEKDIKRRATSFLKATNSKIQKKIVKFKTFPKANKIDQNVSSSNHDFENYCMNYDVKSPEGFSDSDSEEDSSIEDDTENSKTQNEHVEYNTEVYNLNLDDFLRVWSVHHNINRNALNPLLKYLQRFDKALCSDYRSLLKTPRTSILKDVFPGSYIHMSLRKNIDLFLKDQQIIPNDINIRINVDGLPIFKDSAQCPAFWIIQGDIIEEIKRKPFIIGVYGGKTKPKSFNEFLRDTIDELKALKKFDYEGTEISLKLVQLLADAPAKSECLNIIGHNGYYSCTKCEVRGKFINGKMSYFDFGAPFRTNTSFRLQNNEEHHNGRSIFEELDYFDMISDIPLDYMHVVLLGVMKKLLKIWFIDVGEFKHGQLDRQKISERIEKINETIPIDFQRKLRSLTFIPRYKASELRSFLLYYGPIVLKNVLKNELYENFMKLHVAMKICVNVKFKTMNNLAQKLIDEFIIEMAQIYGEQEIVHNVHALHHFPKECETHGILDNFSCFEFENNMSLIKKSIHSSKNPMQQLKNRIAEINSIRHLPSFYDHHSKISNDIFKNNRAVLKGYTFLTNHRDCYALVENKVFKISLFFEKGNKKYAKGNFFKKYSDIYNYPISSSFINMNHSGE